MTHPTDTIRTKPLFWLALALVVSLCWTTTARADWPQFRGPNRTGKAEAQNLLKTWPEGGPERLWENDQVGYGFSSAAVTDQGIYTTGMEGKQGYVYALDLDGNLRWKKNYGEGWNGPHRGARCTPTVHDGKLYIMTSHALAICYDARTGKQVWQVDTKEKFGARQIIWGITENPLIVEGKVIFSPGGEEVGVVALDPETGETIWTCKGIDDQSGYCSPIVVKRGGKTIIAQLMGTTFVGIEADTGKLLWRVERKPEPAYKIQAVSPIYEDGIFYVTTGDGGRRGQMFRLNEDGTGVTRGWSDAELDTLHGGLILHEGHIYGTSHKNNRNKWLCVELKTGEIKAMIDGVGKSSVVYADGLLYGYGHKGRVGLLKPEPDDFRVISSFRITKGKGPHWAHPSITDGKMYLRHGRYLWAYDISAD